MEVCKQIGIHSQWVKYSLFYDSESEKGYIGDQQGVNHCFAVYKYFRINFQAVKYSLFSDI